MMRGKLDNSYAHQLQQVLDLIRDLQTAMVGAHWAYEQGEDSLLRDLAELMERIRNLINKWIITLANCEQPRKGDRLAR